MRFKPVLAVAAAAVLALPAAAAAKTASVKVAPSSAGRILVDTHGKTLYLWAHDKGAASTCNGQCAKYWPPLITTGKPEAGAGARAALLATSRRADGRMQVTYHGHPLYYYVGDTRRGDVKGEGLTAFGGRSDPVSAAGAAVRKAAASGYTSPTSRSSTTPTRRRSTPAPTPERPDWSSCSRPLRRPPGRRCKARRPTLRACSSSTRSRRCAA